MNCIVCDSPNISEVIADSYGFGSVTLGTKHWLCGDCGFQSVTGSQLDHNLQCKVIEIEGPHKPIEIGGIHHANVYFDWVWAGRGFGQLSFSMNRETGVITCNNECMSRDSVRQILRALADHIADNVELEDESHA